jgi:DNA integrity scanning protein DisA with diadenylate cyclase activity
VFGAICKKLTPDCEPRAWEQTIRLAVEFALEKREGRRIGTMFVIGDEEAALKKSRPLILDRLQEYRPNAKEIDDVNDNLEPSEYFSNHDLSSLS